jgi:gamma-glutamylcyclotransferase (GGCT)/AIG2-like uncharacterized protein YtfP
MQSVTGRCLDPIAATLTGYQRFKFIDRTFPGIIKNKSRSIDGMLYKNIDEQTLEQLDHFEGDMYERYSLDVQVDDQIKKVFVYVVKDEYKSCLSNKEWDLEEFKRKYLKMYLRDISEF